MKKIYFILSYLSLVNAFSNLVSLNNITPKKNFCLNMQDNVNLKSFDKIDTDKSGTLDENELKKYYGNTDLLKLGDLNNDKKLSLVNNDGINNLNYTIVDKQKLHNIVEHIKVDI